MIAGSRIVLISNPLKLTARFRTKINKQSVEKKPEKLASDVTTYLESTAEYENIKKILPKSLLRKYKSPESMYLINEKTAKEIAKSVKNVLDDGSPIVEVNPGVCILTKELLQMHKRELYLYETSNHFAPILDDLQKQYPGRVKYKIADFFGMWKLAFQDKMDGGNRVKDLLGTLSTEDNERIIKVIGAMPGLNFMKHLINTIIFHNTGNQLGRPDLFITMPSHHYEFLTDSTVQQGKHKSLPALFQSLFDCKILTKLPKVHFLPWTHSSNDKKLSVIDENCLCLVNITQKEKLPCPPEYLPLFWYFFKPHTFSKSSRVIPLLEQWIPGCGVWLITGQDPPDTNKNLSPDKHDAPLPHMTIFTEFGDLNLRQKITVFKRFISWPEFEQCPFRATMENNLPKFVSAIEDDDDKNSRISAHIDDIDHSDTDNDPENI
ncbi:dimethyladenosine transferase 2, mitochondrial [Epargyreus clarus]|uniref:dimethyladenosine transferase 2, mitochondrial n=1 Tax=Epargyreus clarus TaxID=520877 RepID=UPI003C2FA6E1